MPVKYVGRVTSFRGKRLFDILARLKNFGVGRIVYRHIFNERYAEPSYFVITKVEPLMHDPSEKYTDDTKVKARAYGTKVWRGEQYPECKIASGFKSDWRLVPRDEEHLWIEKAEKTTARPVPIVPDTDRMPPLMEYLVRQDMKFKGVEPSSEDFVLHLAKSHSKYNRCIYESDLKTQEGNV